MLRNMEKYLIGGAIIAGLIFLTVFLVGCFSPAGGGIPNFAEVAPGVYRSGQPTTLDQWRSLYDKGIRYVLKFNYPSEGTDDLALQAGLKVFTYSIQPEGDQNLFKDIEGTVLEPDETVLEQADALMNQLWIGLKAGAPEGVLIHCSHGEDRTGYVVGRFRMKRMGWTKKAAFEEALKRGFHPELLGLMAAWVKLKN